MNSKRQKSRQELNSSAFLWRSQGGGRRRKGCLKSRRRGRRSLEAEDSTSCCVKRSARGSGEKRREVSTFSSKSFWLICRTTGGGLMWGREEGRKVSSVNYCNRQRSSRRGDAWMMLTKRRCTPVQDGRRKTKEEV